MYGTMDAIRAAFQIRSCGDGPVLTYWLHTREDYLGRTTDTWVEDGHLDGTPISPAEVERTIPLTVPLSPD